MSDQTFAKRRYTELRTALKLYAPNLLPPNQKHFLDIGCGTGDLLKIVESDGWNVSGTEISAIAIEQAGDAFSQKILLGDILALDLPTNFYDVITSYHVIEHLLNPVDVLSKIYSLLRPNGIAFIETPNLGGLGARIRGKQWSHIIPPEHLTYFETGSFSYALRQAGFANPQIVTSSPQVINSIAALPTLVQSVAAMVYRLAPLVGMGAALQAIAIKGE